jgi:hypothetical protein
MLATIGSFKDYPACALKEIGTSPYSLLAGTEYISVFPQKIGLSREQGAAPQAELEFRAQKA